MAVRKSLSFECWFLPMPCARRGNKQAHETHTTINARIATVHDDVRRNWAGGPITTRTFRKCPPGAR